MFNSIRARLSLLVVLGLIAVLLVSLMGAFNARNDTIELKKRELHARVQIATTLIEHYVARAASGAMSTKQAQKAAKQAVAALRYGSNGYYWIQDMTPTMVMHPIKPGLDGKPLGKIKDVTGSRFFVKMAALVRQQPQGGVVTYHFPKPGAKTASKKFSYVMPVPEWGWVVGTGEYFDDVNAMTWHMLERALIIAVIAAIIYSLLAFLLNRSIAQPLRSLGRAMHAISTGRADLTQRMPDFRLQEVRTLREAYNRFMDKLDALVSRLKRSTSTLHEAGQTILQETVQLHDGMDRQKAETDQVVAATNEMSASIDEVAQGANHAANNATEMRQSTRDGQTTMQALSNAMTRVDQTIETAFSAITGARTDAEQINRVLDVISEISQQTNLLSLNAAIEAARAGEHGRGFAVVADEVRQLAIKTQQSIAEIQQIIEKLQSGVNASADTMDQGRRVVSAAIDQNGAVLTAFEDIAARAEEMSNLNDQTASAVEEQSAVVREIDHKITEINSVTENSFAVAEQIHAAIRDIKGLSEHLTDEVAELRTSADS